MSLTHATNRGTRRGRSRSGGPISACSLSQRLTLLPLSKRLIKNHRRRRRGIQTFHSGRHRDVDPRIRAVHDLFRQSCSFISHEQRNRLTPIHFPRRRRICACLVHTRCQRVNPIHLQLRQQNRQAHPAKIGKCSAAPAEARIAFGAYGLAVALWPVADVTAPVAPNAAAVRKIVPTFPGSCTPASTTSNGAQASSGLAI